MCLNIGTPNNHHFPFGTNGKVVVLGVPILKHFWVNYEQTANTHQCKLINVYQLFKFYGLFKGISAHCKDMQADLCLCCHMYHMVPFHYMQLKKNWNGVLNEDEELRRKKMLYWF